MTPEEIAAIDAEYTKYPVRVGEPAKPLVRWWWCCPLCSLPWPLHATGCPHKGLPRE